VAGPLKAAAAGDAAPAPLYPADLSQHILVCCCPAAVKPEQAPAWARGILQQLKPLKLLLIGSMQARALLTYKGGLLFQMPAAYSRSRAVQSYACS
jgi:hypothetical protein